MSSPDYGAEQVGFDDITFLGLQIHTQKEDANKKKNYFFHNGWVWWMQIQDPIDYLNLYDPEGNWFGSV